MTPNKYQYIHKYKTCSVIFYLKFCTLPYYEISALMEMMRGGSSYVCMTDTECCLIFYPMKNAYTINAVVTQRTERNVYAQVAKHSSVMCDCCPCVSSC